MRISSNAHDFDFLINETLRAFVLNNPNLDR